MEHTYTTITDIERHASSIVERWERDNAANIAALTAAIREQIDFGRRPSSEDVDWDRAEARAYELLETSEAAAKLGRKGRAVNSAAQQRAARLNSQWFGDSAKVSARALELALAA